MLLCQQERSQVVCSLPCRSSVSVPLVFEGWVASCWQSLAGPALEGLDLGLSIKVST